MARIELRDTTIRMKDGFGGSALINDTPAGTDTTLVIDTLTDLPNGRTTVPVGARFTIDTVADTVFTVTARNNNEVQTVGVGGASGGTFKLTFDGQQTSTIAFDALAAAVQSALEALSNIAPGDVVVTGTAPTWVVEFRGAYLGTNVPAMTIDGTGLTGGTPLVTTTHPGGTTWELTFSPAIDSGDVPANNDVITFAPIEIEIKVGDGNLTYTENKNYDYLLDRGNLDTVREGDEAPLDLSLEFVYEFVRTGTSESVTPVDALKGIGGASDWTSSASDPCTPYCVDIEIEYSAPCGTAEDETTLFPEFRHDSLDFDLSAATIAVKGRCNATEPTITRG